MPVSPYLLNYGLADANPLVQLEQTPVEEMKALNASEAANYYTNQARTLDLMQQAREMAVREPDNQKIKDFYQGLKSRLDKYVQNNNYDDVGNVLDKEVMDYQQNFDLQGALKSKQLENDYINQLRTGGYSEEQINDALQRADAANKSEVTFDPKLWRYNGMFKAELPAKNVSEEMIKTLSDYGRGIKADLAPVTFSNGLTLKKVGGQTYKILGETEEKIDQDEVRRILDGVIESNPEYTAYLKNMADIKTAQLFTTKDELGNFVYGIDDKGKNKKLEGVQALRNYATLKGYTINNAEDLNRALEDLAIKEHGYTSTFLRNKQKEIDNMSFDAETDEEKREAEIEQKNLDEIKAKIEKTKEDILQGKDDYYNKDINNMFYQNEKNKFINPPTEKYSYSKVTPTYLDDDVAADAAKKWTEYSIDKQKERDKAKELFAFTTDYNSNNVTTFGDAQKTLTNEQEKLDDLKRQLQVAKTQAQNYPTLANPSYIEGLEKQVEEQQKIVDLGKEQKGNFLNQYEFKDDDLKSIIRSNPEQILKDLGNNFNDVLVSGVISTLLPYTNKNLSHEQYEANMNTVQENLLQLAKNNPKVREIILQNADIENNAALNSQIVSEDKKNETYYIPEDSKDEIYNSYKQNAVAELNGGDIKIYNTNTTLNDVIHNPVKNGFSTNTLTTRPKSTIKSETIGSKNQVKETSKAAKNARGIDYGVEEKNTITQEITPSDISYEKSVVQPINLENGKGFGYLFKARDKEGNPVYAGDKPFEFILESNSKKNINRNVKTMALQRSNSEKYNPSDETIKQSDEMIGIADFSPQLDFVSKTKEKVVPAQIQTNKGTFNIEVVKNPKGGITVQHQENKAPFLLTNYDNKQISSFKNLKEFYQLLAYTKNNYAFRNE